MEYTVFMFENLNFHDLDQIHKYTCCLYVPLSRNEDDFTHRNYAWYESELELLNVPIVRTTHSRQSLSFRRPVIWNDLLQVVRENENYTSFKKHLKLNINDIIQL